MPVNPFLPAIPQPTDNISSSQGQLLQNNGVIDSASNGFTREHITMTDTTLGGLHRQVTMLNLATLSSPPSAPPLAGYGTYWTTKANVFGSTTQGVYKSGDTASIAITSGVKAWGYFTQSAGVITMVDGYNFDSTTLTYNSIGNYTLKFLTALPDANFGANVSAGLKTTGLALWGMYGNNSASQIDILFNTATSASGAVPRDAVNFTVTVYRS